MKRSTKAILTLLATSFLGACGPASLTFRSNDASQNNGNGNLACTPTSVVAPSQNGLSGSLYYLPAGAANFSSVYDYLKPTFLDPRVMFFSALNVPTRLNTMGYPDFNNKALTNSSGQTLTTNFALDLKTAIALSSSDSAGDYQFGILSDDGAILSSIDSNGNSQDLVNNDGLHPTQFGCGGSVVNFSSSTKLNVEMKYYQGPANEISLVLLWRKIPAGTKPNNTYCGDQGNNTFFDPSTQAPQTEYKNILALGWKPLVNKNFLMPAQNSNSCN